MGGNALKNTFTRRYDKDEYFTLSTSVRNLFWGFYPVSKLAIIPAFREKESFGDMDILYTTQNDKPLGVENLAEVFKSNEVVRNTSVISLDHKELQIDLIWMEDEFFNYAYNYYSWNDTGNLVGKLAHQLGLKHGHKGLVLPLRDGNNNFADVIISLDHDKTLQFLGLDFDKFNSGFDNLTDIFNFISASQYYNPENYKLENLNSIAKIRDRKRETYKKFLEFGESWNGVSAPKIVDKSKCLKMIFDFFPEAYPSYKEAIQKLAMQQLAKTKFNGDMVAELTGLGARELGEFMKVLRNDWYFTPENIVYLTQEQIVGNIKLLFIDHIKKQDFVTIKDMKFKNRNCF